MVGRVEADDEAEDRVASSRQLGELANHLVDSAPEGHRPLATGAVCGEAPETDRWTLYSDAPEQLLPRKRSNVTVPARLPLPAGAVTVTESFGTQVCALVSDAATVETTTSSPVSSHAVLLAAGVCSQPLAGLQESNVQAFESSHERASLVQAWSTQRSLRV